MAQFNESLSLSKNLAEMNHSVNIILRLQNNFFIITSYFAESQSEANLVNTWAFFHFAQVFRVNQVLTHCLKARA